MKLTEEQVAYAANLARLELVEVQLTQFTKELTDLLTCAERLQAVDTGGVAPTAHVLSLTNVLREDQPRPSLLREEALANAPDAYRGCFRVPQIIEGE